MHSFYLYVCEWDHKGLRLGELLIFHGVYYCGFAYHCGLMIDPGAKALEPVSEEDHCSHVWGEWPWTTGTHSVLIFSHWLQWEGKRSRDEWGKQGGRWALRSNPCSISCLPFQQCERTLVSRVQNHKFTSFLTIYQRDKKNPVAAPSITQVHLLW